MMGDSFRITYALCIIFLQFSLYYLLPVEKNISYSSAVSNDQNLCTNSIAQYLYNSTYTKNCMKESFPLDINTLTLDDENIEKFLCLGVYDAIYKVCQYVGHNKKLDTYKDEKNLTLSIEKFIQLKPDNAGAKFCKTLSGFTPMYERVKPALLPFSKTLNISAKCYKLCYDIKDELNHLCAVLAWINEIDQDVKGNPKKAENNNNLNDLNKNEHNDIKNIKPQPSNGESNNDKKNSNPSQPSGNEAEMKKKPQLPLNIASITSVTSKNTGTNDNNNNISNDNYKSLPSGKVDQDSIANDQQKDTETKESSKKETSKFNYKVTVPHVPSTITNGKTESSNVKTQSITSNADPENDLTKTDKKLVETNKDSITGDDKNVMVDEMETTTFSGTTQDNIDDNENIANAEDNNHMDIDQQSNNLADGAGQPIDTDNRNENLPEISEQRETVNFHDIKGDEESHFLTYFMIISLGFIAGYIGYHNKQKILAIVLEGRRSKNNRGRRRPSTANYRKLDCTLEEAVTSQCNANVTHVIY